MRSLVKTVPTTATKKAATEITASADKRTADQEAASSQQQPVSVGGGGAAVTEDANVKRSAASPGTGFMFDFAWIVGNSTLFNIFNIKIIGRVDFSLYIVYSA